MWRDLIETHFHSEPDKSSAARPSSSSQPLEYAGGQTYAGQPLPSIPSIDEEPLPLPSQDRVPPSRDGVNEMRPNLFGHPEDDLMDVSAKPDGSPAAHQSSSSPPLGPADGWTDIMQLVSSILKDTSPVSSPDHSPPSPGSLTESGYKLMRGDAPPGLSGPAALTVSSADHELMGAHALPNPGPSTESDHEMIDVLPSSPVSPTNPDGQPMGADSPSGKRSMALGLVSSI
jgi:hypothetical protein